MAQLFSLGGNYFANALFKIYAIRLHRHIRSDWFDVVLCFRDLGFAGFQGFGFWRDGLLPRVLLLVAPIYFGSFVYHGRFSYLHFDLPDSHASSLTRPARLAL